MKTIDIHYAGRTVALPDLPDYAKFYRKLAAGTWEPQTFAVLGHNLDADTTYIDIGAWIGVTPFWAVQRAKLVIAVEPDPTCFEILHTLAASVPNIRIVHGAVSTSPRVTINAVDGFGSSETTLLEIGDGESVTVPGITMAELLRLAGPGPIFVKIDIEGYEFAMTDEIAKLAHENVRGLQIALHPQLLEKSLKGPQVFRRLRAAWAVWRLGRVFRGFFNAPRLPKYDSLMSYLIAGVLFRVQPRGSDLVFERTMRATSEEPT